MMNEMTVDKGAQPAETPLAIWAQQTRAPFLILSVALVLLGSGAAFAQGVWNWFHFLLLIIGVVLAHASVNLFNELSDHRTGIDFHTRRTPFSGGSGMLTAGKTTPGAVRAAAYGTLAVSMTIGLYFCIASGWLLLAFIVIGAVSIRFYTSHLARWLMGELFAGLALGTLVVMGVYYALVGKLSPAVIFISVPPGILTWQLLFLNEFPDAEADRMGGRRHLVIQLGKKASAALYAFLMTLTYIIIAAAPLAVKAPPTVLLGLLSAPMAFKAASIALKNHDCHTGLLPALGLNVGVVLLTDFLLAAGLFLGRWV